MVLPLLLACGAPEVAPARAGATALDRAPAASPDLVVDCHGGADERTIQGAIDRARDHAFVSVRPCTYHESLDYRGKSLWIASTAGSASTVIDAGGADKVVRVASGEGAGTALVGFTLRDADNALFLDLSAMRLEDVVIRDTTGHRVLENQGGALVLVDVTIDGSNTASDEVLLSHRGTLVLRHDTLACGEDDGIVTQHGGFQIDDSVVDCPDLGSGPPKALDVDHSTGWVQRSNLRGRVTIVSEEEHPDDLVAFRNSSVIGDVDVSFGTFLFRNSVLARGTLTLTDTGPTVTLENSIFGGAACAVGGNVPPGTVRNDDFFQTVDACVGPSVVGQDGNLAVAPGFVDPATGDFHLRPGSPLVDAGVPDADYDDLDGTRSDLGIYGGKFTQDGGW